MLVFTNNAKKENRKKNSMASSILPPTNGKAECAFLRAALSNQGDSVASLLRSGVDECPDAELPGTTRKPDWIDIDAFAMLLAMDAFETHVPLSFNVAIGGVTKPRSSDELKRATGFVFVGTMNSNIYVHVREEDARALFFALRATLPSPSEHQVTKTKVKTHSMEVVLAAMKEAHIGLLALVSYGLEDKIPAEITGGEVLISLRPHQEHIKNWCDSSYGFRIDVGCVWLEEDGTTRYLSLPGQPTGIRVFQVGVPLQSLTHFMRALRKEKHFDSDISSTFRGGGWKGGALTAYAGFLKSQGNFDVVGTNSGGWSLKQTSDTHIFRSFSCLLSSWVSFSPLKPKQQRRSTRKAS